METSGVDSMVFSIPFSTFWTLKMGWLGYTILEGKANFSSRLVHPMKSVEVPAVQSNCPLFSRKPIAGKCSLFVYHELWESLSTVVL